MLKFDKEQGVFGVWWVCVVCLAELDTNTLGSFPCRERH